jgi:hypothetical protein
MVAPASPEEMAREQVAQWYLTFISIVFGVFFGVWLAPISDVYLRLDDQQLPKVMIHPPGSKQPTIQDETPACAPTLLGLMERTDQTPTKVTVSRTLEWFRTGNFVRGAIMFLILVCLWWWYGRFLSHVMPAESFWLYVFDFVSLCFFSIAFRMWHHHELFPFIVVLAATMMLLRFLMARVKVPAGSRARSSIHLALWILGCFIALGMAAGTGIVVTLAQLGTEVDLIEKHWDKVENSTLALLALGILVTCAAAWKTEGPPFRSPRLPAAWTKCES